MSVVKKSAPTMTNGTTDAMTTDAVNVGVLRRQGRWTFCCWSSGSVCGSKTTVLTSGAFRCGRR